MIHLCLCTICCVPFCLFIVCARTFPKSQSGAFFLSLLPFGFLPLRAHSPCCRLYHPSPPSPCLTPHRFRPPDSMSIPSRPPSTTRSVANTDTVGSSSRRRPVRRGGLTVRGAAAITAPLTTQTVRISDTRAQRVDGIHMQSMRQVVRQRPCGRLASGCGADWAPLTLPSQRSDRHRTPTLPLTLFSCWIMHICVMLLLPGRRHVARRVRTQGARHGRGAKRHSSRLLTAAPPASSAHTLCTCTDIGADSAMLSQRVECTI